MLHPPFPSVLDNTILNAYRSCGRQAQLAYIEHWKPQGVSVHLHAGAAFARGLEVARKAFFDHAQDAETAMALGLRALVDAYGDFECPPDSAKSLERMCGAFEYYLGEAFPIAADSAVPKVMPSGQRAIEFSFCEPLPVDHPETGDPILYSGRADAVVEMENGIFVMDDKTTSSLGRSWADQWELRSQFTGYSWAARQAGFPADGVLVRGISILKTRYDHAQHITYRPQWEIDRWLKQTVRDVKRMIEDWAIGDFAYNLGEACNHYGGCSFAAICKKQHPEEWLPVYFEQRRWDPLTRTEERLNANT
jgi:hypothetical protein